MMWRLFKIRHKQSRVARIPDFLCYRGFQSPAKTNKPTQARLTGAWEPGGFPSCCILPSSGCPCTSPCRRTAAMHKRTTLANTPPAPSTRTPPSQHPTPSQCLHFCVEQRDEWVGSGNVLESLKKSRTWIGLYYHHVCVDIFWCVSHVPVPSSAAQGPRITNEFVQHVKYLAKGRPLCSLPLPAVQHQLVQHHWTVHWSGQTVALFYRFDHLVNAHKAGKGKRCSECVGSESPSQFTQIFCEAIIYTQV